ncbi:MAG: 2-oxoglutarate dehydrogenase complex dihydrolipoyllysine-residue succinyltransferase [Chloroflexaceae bacterium]|nr:2-oxoglutarate dehydrogenase complex dihydrolipoyllysine-residue succinyltransferase [Chloroflexaceae bacterium]
MSTEIRVPSLGESIIEATISKWVKREGDSVVAGEPVLELETDKVNLEVSAEKSGVLQAIAKQEGDTVRIGDVVGIIQENQETGAHRAPAVTTSTAAAELNGEAARAAAPEVPVAEGRPAETTVPAQNDTSTVTISQPPAAAPEVQATPLAQRMAAEHHIDIRWVKGSGPGGRVTKEDVAAFLNSGTTSAPPESPAPVQPTPAPSSAPPGQADSSPKMVPATSATLPLATRPIDAEREERVTMSRRRQTIARRLVEAQQTAAILTTFNEMNMAAVMDIRTRHKDRFRERHGITLGFMSFFTRATVGALKAFPLLNAEIQDDTIVVKHYYDIGIAVGTEQGLVVPVLRDAERKSFAQIEQDIADLATRARSNTLGITDLQGGTFSITNGGIYGSLMSTPILNMPQVGILGLHKIEERPVAVNGSVQICPMMYVALSYDHRIVDGSEAVRFLVHVKELIEDPEALLLEG